MTPEQKKKLKDKLFGLDPKAAHDEIFSLIAGLEVSIQTIMEKFKAMDYLILKFTKDVESMIDSKISEHGSKVSDIETKIYATVGRHRSSIDETVGKTSKELELTKSEARQMVREIRDEMRVSFSKMGGATMPILLQKEDALFVPDGTTSTYYFYNKPVYIVVGGGVMTEGDGYATPVPQTDGYKVTFSFPPQSGQTPHSFHY